MGSHINHTIDSFSRRYEDLERVKIKAELEFWKQRAEYLEDEIRNIPAALREYGEWYVTDDDRVTTHVILDPKHHPAETKE